MGKFRDKFIRAKAVELIDNMREDFNGILEDIENHSAEENVVRITLLGSNYCSDIEEEFEKIHKKD